MTKGMRKDFQREIKLNFSRFLSITLIVVLGVAFFSGLRAAKPAMQASADKQYDSENLMDIRVAGTLGMTDKDVDALKKVDGVQDAEGTYEQDFLCDTGNSEAHGHRPNDGRRGLRGLGRGRHFVGGRSGPAPWTHERAHHDEGSRRGSGSRHRAKAQGE